MRPLGPTIVAVRKPRSPASSVMAPPATRTSDPKRLPAYRAPSDPTAIVLRVDTPLAIEVRVAPSQVSTLSPEVSMRYAFPLATAIAANDAVNSPDGAVNSVERVPPGP